MGGKKQDPALYRVIETIRTPDGRLSRCGRVWQPDLERTRRFGRVLSANSAAQRVEVGDEHGVIEVIPPPPPGAPVPGWGDWSSQMDRQAPLPMLPPRPAPASHAPRPTGGLGALVAGRQTPPPPPAPPKVLPELPPENAVERTATIP